MGMGASHSHSHGPVPALRLGRWSKWVVIGLIALSGLVAVAGMLRWMPDAERVEAVQGMIPFAAPGVEVVPAELLSVAVSCQAAQTVAGAPCGSSDVRILEGPDAGTEASVELMPNVLSAGLRIGDRLLLIDQSTIADDRVPDYSFYRFDRGPSLLWIAIVFAVAVVAVARLRGFMALVSLAFAGAVVMLYLIPALLSGQPAVPVTIAASVIILIVMLYATHGFSMRTSVALLGALIGVGITAFGAWFAIIGSRIGPQGSESAGLLAYNVEWITIQQLITASVILAGLGTLNDVTITQVSALWELRGASPSATRWDLFRRGMRIGRDHIASTVYTLVFAYLGTALLLLIAAQLYEGTPYDFITGDGVAEEIVRALVGGIALVLAMPITTVIAALIVPPPTALDASAPDAPAPTIAARRAREAKARVQAPAPAPDAMRHLPDNPWSSS